MITRFDQLILLLGTAKVEFIIVGGVAASAHGSARSTEDLDIVYRRTPENVARLVGALAPCQPYLRRLQDCRSGGMSGPSGMV
jgi:hypothetical protein